MVLSNCSLFQFLEYWHLYLWGVQRPGQDQFLCGRSASHWEDS